MPMFHLSKRMTAVAHLVPVGATVCDVGCDHGFVAIYLVENKISPQAIAMDINEGPLLRAKEHIEKAALSTYIETRLSDGLKKLAVGEADCMIAAGMGGKLIGKILEDDPEKLKNIRYLVLQPQSEIALVRRILRKWGFLIKREDMVMEDGKYYPMMLAEATGETDSRKIEDARQDYMQSLEDEFGPCLLKDRNPVLIQYLDWWETQQNEILNHVLTHLERRAEVEKELARIRDARKIMEIKRE